MEDSNLHTPIPPLNLLYWKRIWKVNRDKAFYGILDKIYIYSYIFYCNFCIFSYISYLVYTRI